ncbi:MAG: T9SS type A sorting domain-containing protein [Ignavibacteriaceae bacterium]
MIVFHLPHSIQLYQNYPNPFNPFTTIQFENSEDAFISLEIYNSVGEKVATLFNNVVEAGIHTIKFDSSEIASGIYIYKIVSGKYSESKKMVLLK